MSAYQTYKTQFNRNHKDVLVQALKAVGLTAQSFDDPKSLFGYTGDERKTRAHVVVRRANIGSASNDLGWEYLADGTCVSHISDYDSSRFSEQWQNNLAMKYSELFIRKIAEENGMSVGMEVQADGTVQLQLVNLY